MDTSKASQQASLLRIQNMMKLCQHLRLPVSYKVHSIHHHQQLTAADPATAANGAAPDATKFSCSNSQQQDAGTREFAVVVHVMSDYAFKRYLQHCSGSDLLLLRGLLLKVETDAALSTILSAEVQQAFLPKFENEGQDSSIADAIVQQADERAMVVTIKHSGSLVTLSSKGFAAKNSLDNEFTAGAALLLQAHFARLLGSPEAGQKRLLEFMAALKQQQLAVSFEMVTGCHGHHGQLPAAEYLVATSAHTASLSGQPQFLTWAQFLEFCLHWNLPLNDTWIIRGSSAAAAARDLLDHMALSGCPTAAALQQLTSLVVSAVGPVAVTTTAVGSGSSGGGGAAGSDNPELSPGSSAAAKKQKQPCGVHLPGSYPHDEWQGSRIEGFVVSQGQAMSAEGPGSSWQQLLDVRDKMVQQVVKLESVQQELRKPYQDLLSKSGGDIAATRAVVKAACASWLPDVSYTPLPDSERLTLLDCLGKFSVNLDCPPAAMHLPDGQLLYSRAAVDSCTTEQLQQLLLTAPPAAGAAAAAATAGATKLDAVNSLQVMQLLSGGVSQGQAALRYKKKMMMWGDQEVGYCMMTFVIRNGLTALRLGELSYLSSLASMAKSSWQLPEPMVEQVVHFGRCWSRWAAAQGGASSIKESTYLSAAEPFVKAFLSGEADAVGGQGARPAGAFQGVLLAVDVEQELLAQLKKALHLQHVLDPTKPDQLIWTKPLVSEGTCLWLEPGQPVPNKRHMAPFMKSAGPYAFVVTQKPSLAGIEGTSQAKKLEGMHMGKIKTITNDLKAAGLSPQQIEQRTLGLTAAAAAAGVGAGDGDHQQQQQQQALIELVMQKFGAGSPLAEADPAFVFCFATLPGIGKSVLSAELTQLASSSSSNPQQHRSLAVLNSDTLKAKQGVTGMRYWHQVAGAADSYRGGGHQVFVMADKNLVPFPKDNVQRVADILNKSGATTIAVIPTCPVVSQQQQQQQQVHLPFQLPFPLELIALSMLRVLQRRGHEGGLDGALESACSIVVQFAYLFRDLSLPGLARLMSGHFSHVVELPVATVNEDKQVPLEVLQHISEGLATIKESSNPPLPLSWESRMRELLTNPTNQAAITAIQLPLPDCAAQLHASIAGIVDGSSSKPAAAAAAARAASAAAADLAMARLASTEAMDVDGGPVAAAAGVKAAAATEADVVRYVGVAVLEEGQLRQQLQELWEQLEAQQQQQQQQQQEVSEPVQSPAPFKVKSNLHLTLWHREDPTAVLQQRDALAAVAGQEVQLQLVALDVSPEVTAAQAELLDGPDAVSAAWQALAYPHITLAVAAGAQAVDSKKLPARVADAADLRAYRLVLPEPLVVTGQVLVFT